jgi:hypothetical protein
MSEQKFDKSLERLGKRIELTCVTSIILELTQRASKLEREIKELE